MKKMHSVMLSLVAGVAISCVPALGSPAEASKVSVVKQGEVFRVVYEARRTSHVQVTISDNAGNKVFSEKIVGDRFARPYNFSQLPKGDYFLSVTDENSSQTQTMCHHEKALVAQITKMKVQGNKYLVAIPRQNSNMVVSFFDRNDQLVFSESTSSDQDFAKIYSLKNLPGGSIQISSGQTGESKVLQLD